MVGFSNHKKKAMQFSVTSCVVFSRMHLKDLQAGLLSFAIGKDLRIN